MPKHQEKQLWIHYVTWGNWKKSVRQAERGFLQKAEEVDPRNLQAGEPDDNSGKILSQSFAQMIFNYYKKKI